MTNHMGRNDNNPQKRSHDYVEESVRWLAREDGLLARLYEAVQQGKKIDLFAARIILEALMNQIKMDVDNPYAAEHPRMVESLSDWKKQLMPTLIQVAGDEENAKTMLQDELQHLKRCMTR